MLHCDVILFENHLKTAGGPVQSDTLGKAREALLIGSERDWQFAIALLLGAYCEEVIGAPILFFRVFVRRLFAEMNFLMTDKVVLTFGMAQKYVPSAIS